MQQIDQLSQKLGELLLTKHLTVTTAESCTGGGVAQAITEIAGSSQWFTHGFVTYSNPAKMQLLQVPASDFDRYGAVSKRVVEAMASGALVNAGADLAIATSGVAGPGGGSPEKPVGTVWIAWKLQDKALKSEKFIFEGDRKNIRNQTVIKALRGVVSILGKNTV